MNPRKPIALLVCLLGFIITSGPLMGQTTAPAASNWSTPATRLDEETIELSPFVVSTEKDAGYAATNTLAGTRLRSEIMNTPVSLSILTRDFLNDIAAIDANRAMDYVLNASNETDDATGSFRTYFPFNYRVRNFANATNARNYFRSSFLGESYNVDSFEVARGPNSVLFGIASPGGTFNSTIKQARRGEKITAVQLRFGSFNEHRVAVDLARTFGSKKQFAVRLNLLDYDSDGFYEFEKITRRAATLAATWRPFRLTNVRVELEHARFFDARARPFPMSDAFGDWVKAGGVLHTVPTSRPVSTTVATSAGSPNGIAFFPQSTVGAKPVAFSGNYFRTSDSKAVRGGFGTDFASIRDTSLSPRTANTLGMGNGNTSDQDVAGLFVEQRVGRNLFIEAAYYYQGRDYLRRMPQAFNDNLLRYLVSTNDPVFDPITGAQTGYQPSPNAGRFITTGGYQEVADYQRQDNARFTASYNLDLGIFGYHRLSALAERSVARGDTVERREMNISPQRQFVSLMDLRNTINRISFIDFNSPDPVLHALQSRSPISGPLLGVPGVSVQSGLVNYVWRAARNTVNSVIVATQSSFFKERLWITGGIRHDAVSNNTASPIRNPVSFEYLGVNYDRPDDLDVQDTTSSFGAVFHVAPWLSVYANQSDNFNLQGNAILFGETGSNQVAGNTKGLGRDVGIRSKLFGGKVNFSLGYYKTEQVGQRFFMSGTARGAVDYIWAALGEAHPTIVGDDLQTVSGQGIEVELTANPTKNLRFMFNYTHTNSFSQIRNYEYVSAYTDKYKDRWLSPENASKPVSNPFYGSTVQDAWNTLQRVLALDTDTNGREPFLFRPSSANAFARYVFTEGRLKGLAIGGGVNWRGPMVLGYANNDSKQQLRGYEQIFINTLLSYEHRLTPKIKANFQLNIDNLLGFDDVSPRRYYWYGDAQGPSILYQYPAQVRRWSLSTALTF